MKTFDDLWRNKNENESEEILEIPFLKQMAANAQKHLVEAKLSIILEAKKNLFVDKSFSVDEFVDSGFIPFLIDCLKMPK